MKRNINRTEGLALLGDLLFKLKTGENARVTHKMFVQDIVSASSEKKSWATLIKMRIRVVYVVVAFIVVWVGAVGYAVAVLSGLLPSAVGFCARAGDEVTIALISSATLIIWTLFRVIAQLLRRE